MHCSDGLISAREIDRLKRNEQEKKMEAFNKSFLLQMLAKRKFAYNLVSVDHLALQQFSFILCTNFFVGWLLSLFSALLEKLLHSTDTYCLSILHKCCFWSYGDVDFFCSH